MSEPWERIRDEIGGDIHLTNDQDRIRALCEEIIKLRAALEKATEKACAAAEDKCLRWRDANNNIGKRIAWESAARLVPEAIRRARGGGDE